MTLWSAKCPAKCFLAVHWKTYQNIQILWRHLSPAVTPETSHLGIKTVSCIQEISFKNTPWPIILSHMRLQHWRAPAQRWTRQILSGSQQLIPFLPWVCLDCWYMWWHCCICGFSKVNASGIAPLGLWGLNIWYHQGVSEWSCGIHENLETTLNTETWRFSDKLRPLSDYYEHYEHYDDSTGNYSQIASRN